MPAGRRRLLEVGLATGGALVWVLLSWQAKVEDQLAQLHRPGFRSFTYGDLHSEHVRRAFQEWRRGFLSLADFHAVDARTLILQRSAIATALTLVTSMVLIGLLVRIGRAHLSRVALVVLFALTSAAIILLDLALGLPELTQRRTEYGELFPWLDRAPTALLVVLGLTILTPVAQALRPGWRAYRSAPASSRLALGAAVLFFVVCNLGDIGAQLEDLLRRELSADDTGHLWALLGALALYQGVLVVLAQLKYSAPAPTTAGAPPGRTSFRIGAVAMLVGIGLMVVGAQSALMVGGVVMAAIGGASLLVDGLPPRTRRQQLGLRLALALATIGGALVAFGIEFGRDANPELIAVGAASVATAGVLGLVNVRAPSTLDAPSGSEAAAALVALGFVVMGLLHVQRIAVHMGAGIAGLGVLLLLQARAGWHERWKPWLDTVAVAAIVAGGVKVWDEPTGRHLGQGIALAGVGLLFFLGNRTKYVAVPAVAPAPPITGPRPDGSPRGVLLAAALFPAAGLLTSLVRALGGMMATGDSEIADLLLLAAGVAVITVLGAVAIGAIPAPTQDPADGPNPFLVVPLGLVVAVPVVVAAVVLSPNLVDDWASARRFAMNVGDEIGPVALLVGALAGLAAMGGLVRVAVRGRDQLPLFSYLGFHRTPVIGVVLTAFALVVVAGSPLERVEASTHDVRLLERPAAPDPTATVAACTTALAPGDEVARRLCQWIEHVSAGRAADDTTPLPLVLVTASGGGVRAASWTARVLDCLAFEPTTDTRDTAARLKDECPVALPRADRWPYVFAIGGASGGSVGAATAAAQAIAPLPDDGEHGWAVRVGAPDHLGPVFGQMLLAETGLAALGFVPEHDRAETLIDEWAEPFTTVDPQECEALGGVAFRDVGYLAAAEQCPDRVPLLLLNSTIVRTGGRFDISPLDDKAPGAALDLRDVLCDGGEDSDVHFFDAAFASGRFPLVTPSGRLGYDVSCAVRTPVDLVDGGYHENTGAGQVADLWVRLQPLVNRYNETATAPIRPLLVQIVNGNIRTTIVTPRDEPTGTSLGCLAPAAVGGAVEARQVPPEDDLAVQIGEPARIPWAGAPRILDEELPNAANDLVAAFCRSGHPVLTFGLYDHPGRALPLGWSLTVEVLEDMQKVMAMAPNQCRAIAFTRFVADPDQPLDADGCTPCGLDGRLSKRRSVCRDERPEAQR